MKKTIIFTLILSLILTLLFTACGGSNGEETEEPDLGSNGTETTASPTPGINERPSAAGVPATLSLERGASHTFTVEAAGVGNLTYQWFKDGAPVTNNTAINTYTITGANATAHSGTFKVVVTSTVRGTDPETVELECIVTVSTDLPSSLIDQSIAYFVDCGDHNPWSLSEGDKFGRYQSLTEQVYGADAVTGMNWGLVLEKAEFAELDRVINAPPAVADSNGVFTRFTWAYEQSGGNVDGVPKNMSLRYSKDQQSAQWGGVPPFTGLPYNYIKYGFELPVGEYTVEVYFVNTWGNNGSPELWIDGVNAGTASVPTGNDAVGITVSQTVTAFGMEFPNGNGYLDLEVRSTTDGLQIAYIIIK
jgi:hypothetical protein